MISIAIDGGTATGKGTIAKALADKLDFKVLDTGAIFRGIACAFVDFDYRDDCEICENKTYCRLAADSISVVGDICSISELYDIFTE